jgi:hypothetical protein
MDQMNKGQNPKSSQPYREPDRGSEKSGSHQSSSDRNQGDERRTSHPGGTGEHGSKQNPGTSNR